MKKNYLILLLCFASAGNCVKAQTIFNYTGAVQTYTVGACVYTLNVDVKGAGGGTSGASNLGGLGGRVQATLPVTPGEVLDIYVGQAGAMLAGGWNGGGAGGTANSGGGGGASDIRQGGTALSNRVIVAGGGGGTGFCSTCSNNVNGGNGGGLTGAAGYYISQGSAATGKGGTQTVGGAAGAEQFPGTPGSAGIGGNGGGNYGGGGGGGYYGGGGGATNICCWSGGGGGGSSYTIPSAYGVIHTQGFQSGNGQVVITPNTGTAAPVSINGSATICQGATTTYSIAPVPTATSYSWTVPSGAVINSGQGTTAVDVTFGSTSGNVGVAAIGNCGTSPQTTKAVSVNEISLLTSSAPPAICLGDTSWLTSTILTPTSYTFTVGTGTITNTSTGYPAPFGNDYNGSRHQMLINASELSAAGFSAGTITNMAFNVSALNGSNPLVNFTIGMKAVSISSITAFQSGMITVYGPVTDTVTAGWNDYLLTTPFTWDGISNLVIETCFNNTNATNNVSMYQSSTSFTSTVYYRANTATVCTNTSTTSSVAQRPNIRFVMETNKNYSWIPSTGLSDDTVANPFAVPSSTTNYTLTVTNGYGCTASSAVTISVSIPVANAGIDTVICNGQSATLSASGGANYSWSPSAGLSATNIANPVATPISTTTYTVTVTDANGCSADDDVMVTVNSLPVANAGADVSICSGDSAQLNASGGNSYAWNATTGLSNPSISNPMASPGSSTTYTVTVTDANGCSADDDVMVTVNSLPTASAGSDVSICSGDSTQLSASGGVNYMWSPSTGLSNQNISNPVAQPASTVNYVVTVSDANGCTASDSVVVNVLAAPATPTITQNGNILTSSAGVTYQWYYNSVLIFGATNQSYVASQNGVYSVCITDINGCSACSAPYNVTTIGVIENVSAGVTVNVFPNPGNGVFAITVDAEWQGEFTIEVLNLEGEIIYSTKQIKSGKEKQEIKLDLSLLSDGIYFLKIISHEELIIQKLIKQ